MQYGVISDSHDNIWKFDQALEKLSGVDVVFHCGDLISPFMVKRLDEGFGNIPVHVIWGNNDGDKRLLTHFAELSNNVTIHGDFADLKFDGKKIALIHYPEIGRALAAGDQYDLVCYGYDHTAHKELIKGTLLLNPGEIMGLNGHSSLAIVDSETLKVTWVELD